MVVIPRAVDFIVNKVPSPPPSLIPFISAFLASHVRIHLRKGPYRAPDPFVVPAGVDSGHEVEFRGMGLPSQQKGGPAGDLMVEIQVDKHEHFVRDGLNIHHDLKVDFIDAILGAPVR